MTHLDATCTLRVAGFKMQQRAPLQPCEATCCFGTLCTYSAGSCGRLNPPNPPSRHQRPSNCVTLLPIRIKVCQPTSRLGLRVCVKVRQAASRCVKLRQGASSCVKVLPSSLEDSEGKHVAAVWQATTVQCSRMSRGVEKWGRERCGKVARIQHGFVARAEEGQLGFWTALRWVCFFSHKRKHPTDTNLHVKP